jgi:hypothetical protein
MDLAPDFFSYFEATAPLLDADDNLLCVSSWNDHGLVRSVCTDLWAYYYYYLILTIVATSVVAASMLLADATT